MLHAACCPCGSRALCGPPAALQYSQRLPATSAEVLRNAQMDFPPDAASHRILNVHQNVPGVLRDINAIISDLNVNIKAQARASPARSFNSMQGEDLHACSALRGSFRSQSQGVRLTRRDQ